MNKTWFAKPAVRLLAALMLIFAVAASAAPTRNDRTQTSDGNYVQPGKGGPTPPSTSIEIQEPLVFDMNQEVQAKVKQFGITSDQADDDGQTGQYIFGRDDEAKELDEKLKESDGHFVAIQGDPKTGRTGVVEEFVRLHPQDKVFRLNLKKLSLLNEIDATTQLQQLIVDLEKQNIAAKPNRVILYVENLAVLQKGSVMHPIAALWEQVVRGANLNFIVEADPATLSAELKPNDKSTFKNLIDLVETMEVKPPSYDAVVSYLLRYRSNLQKSGVTISTFALEEAARIAVRYYKTSPFKAAYSLAEAAVNWVVEEKTGGKSTLEALRGSIKQLETRKKNLNDDLAVETNPEDRQKITDSIAEIDDDLTTKRGELANISTPADIGIRLANVELELEAKNTERDEAEKRLGMFQRRNPEIEALDAQIRALTTQRTQLEAEKMAGRGDAGQPATRAGVRQVISVAAKRLNIPPNRLSANIDEGIRKIQDIKKVVFGQNHVIDALEQQLLINRSHLNDGRELTPEQVKLVKKGLLDDSLRPVGTFWFAGSTGVGKTEVAKQLANLLGYDLLSFDMSEFQEKHFVSQLIGAPPGYVGYENPGRLTEGVRVTPECVVLLDEIEKAHPDILNLLLQVMDEGRLTDNHGRTIDFRKVVLIMTSNLAQEIGGWNRGQAIDFLKKHGWTDERISSVTQYDTLTLRKEAYKVFVSDPVEMGSRGLQPMRPEIFQRIDDILMFLPLDTDVKIKIVQKTMKQFMWRMKEFYDIKVKFSNDLITKLVASIDETQGGRNARRNFDKFIRAPLARMIVDKKVAEGDTLAIGLNDNDNLMVIDAAPEQLSDAEEKTKSNTPELTDLKDRLLIARGKNLKERAARSATAEMVKKIFDPEWLISDRAFGFLRK